MKRFLTFLMTVMALFAFATSVRAQNVYLLTKQELNGQPTHSHLMEYTGVGQIYKLRVYSMPSDQFNFKVGVQGWEKDMQAHTDNCQLPIYESTPADGDKYEITNDCWGDKKYWLVKDYSAYEELYIYVDINTNSGGKKYVWVEGKKKGSTPVTPTAKTIYMFTAQTVNGQEGNYSTDTPIEEHKLSLVDGETTLYKYEVNTSTSDENFWFRFYVKDETKQLQPQANDDPVTVTAADASTSVYTNIDEGNSNAWKTTFDKSAYDKLTIYLDIATPRRLWIVGSKNSVVTEKKYVLVDNKGAEVSENTTGSFVYNLTNATADAVVSFKIDGAAYGLTAPANITAAGTTSYTATKGATGTLTLAKCLKYDITIADDGKVTVVATENAPIVTTAPAGFYLVGNFMSPANVGGDINPGGDAVDKINYDRLYFRFTQQSDKKYSFDIPACLTAKMQILAVDDDGTKTVYGPNSVYDLHGGFPGTDTTVSGILTPNADVNESSNYWSLKTRNDGTYDDDGMYTVSFEVDESGTPVNWSISHNSLKMVAYLLSTSYGASALPIYDKRTDINSLYGQNIKANIHFDGKNSYYVLGYSVYGLGDDQIRNKADEAYKKSGASEGIHTNIKIGNNYGTQNKLFFFGNGGYKYGNSDKHNKLVVNQKPFTLNISGTKTVEYNPNKGDNDLSKQANACGMSASFYIPNEGTVDYPNVISLVGSAIPGTTNADGSWNWASNVADMTFDATENCYYVTIETTKDCHVEHFRFVGDHDKAKNWHEDDATVGAKTAGCDHWNKVGHKCTVDDPNTISCTFNGTTENTDDGYNIMWNRPAGLYTVKLYMTTDENNGYATVFKYTITGESNSKFPFTLLKDKFIRTFSSHKAMDIVSPDVKAYVAYKYEKPGGDEISQAYSCGKLYLRQLNYIPADMGVVLIGATPGDGTFDDGDKLSYSLRLRTDASATTPAEFVNIWTKASEYTGQEWNNYLVPTVEADDNLRNADKVDGVVTYRNFGLSTFFRTKYHKENPDAVIPNYLGFFRLMDNTKSGGNKAYLKLPANDTVGDGVGAKFGYCDYNGQFIGGTTDDDSSAFAKMMILFDDELGGVTEINKVEVTNKCHDNAYYTLQGIKVLKPTKGIYIHNGKKIVIK